MLKISYAGCLQPFRCTSLLNCVSQPKIAKTITKTVYFGGVQGHLSSSMLTFLKSSLSVLIMIGRMSVPICNHFHVRRANSSRITLLVRGDPFHPVA